MSNITRFYELTELAIGDRVQLLPDDHIDFGRHEEFRGAVEDLRRMMRESKSDDLHVVALVNYQSDHAHYGVQVQVVGNNRESSYVLPPDFFGPVNGHPTRRMQVREEFLNIYNRLRAMLDSDDIHMDVGQLADNIKTYLEA